MNNTKIYYTIVLLAVYLVLNELRKFGTNPVTGIKILFNQTNIRTMATIDVLQKVSLSVVAIDRKGNTVPDAVTDIVFTSNDPSVVVIQELNGVQYAAAVAIGSATVSVSATVNGVAYTDAAPVVVTAAGASGVKLAFGTPVEQ